VRAVGRSGGQGVGRSDGRTVGSTLVELLVVLTILALLSGLSTVAVASLRRPPDTAARDTLRAIRARVIRTGEPRTVYLASVTLRLLPDGRVLGGAVDPLTGAWPDAR